MKHTQTLPKGWKWVKLGDVCYEDKNIVDPESEEAKVLPYLSLEHVESETGKILKNGECIENEGQSTTFLFNNNHVLYGKLRPYLNKVALPGYEGRCTTELIPFLPDNSLISREFLALVLRRKETVEVSMRGVTGSRMPRANMKELLQMQIPLPPLLEQKRIAKILNDCLAAVEKARQAGQAQLEAAQSLPAAYLREVFESEQAKKWERVKLKNVFKLKSGEFLPASSMAESGTYPVYGGNGIAGWHTSYMFEESKIIIGRVGALCGCVHATKPQSWVTDNALYISDKYAPFDDYFMMNYLTFLNLNQLANQMGQPVIASSKIYDQIIGLPSITEQQRIAKFLDPKLKSTEQLRRSLEDQLKEINAIPASLLRKAFQGEL